jgi:protein-tyrosine phosphatase
MLSANTPILSTNFTLPTKCKSFKIRHNEELPTIPCGNPFEENTANLFKLGNIPNDCSRIPRWVTETILDKSGRPITHRINDQFYALEKLEQKRLITALSLNTVNDISPMNEVAPKISCGIEFGNKNRYKDIFLYDHSRVELGHINNNPNDILNYINASYIEPPEKFRHPQSKYIATQGPLDETMGDLWKLVMMRKIPLVISLTDSIENGVMKCAPFWQSGIYKSYEDTIKVTVVDNEEVEENLIVRTFKIKCNDEPTRKVKQIQLLSWPDMGTTSNPEDILKVIELKQKILQESSEEDKTTLVHCSAGCGRTGTLCVIDTLINYLNDQNGRDDVDTNEDPVFEITNHFRKLRISMVQTLKQYYLIYETLLSYFDNDKR